MLDPACRVGWCCWDVAGGHGTERARGTGTRAGGLVAWKTASLNQFGWYASRGEEVRVFQVFVLSVFWTVVGLDEASVITGWEAREEVSVWYLIGRLAPSAQGAASASALRPNDGPLQCPWTTPHLHPTRG